MFTLNDINFFYVNEDNCVTKFGVRLQQVQIYFLNISIYNIRNIKDEDVCLLRI